MSNTLLNIDDDIVYATTEQNLKELSKSREGLKEECTQIAAELAQLEFTPAIVRDIKDFAAQIRARFINPDFEMKRALLDLLNFHGRIAYDEMGRFIDVSVGFKRESLPLSVTSSEKNVESPVRVIEG